MSLAMNIPGGGGGPVVGIGGLDAILIHSLQQKIEHKNVWADCLQKHWEHKHLKFDTCLYRKNQLMKTDPMIKGLS